MVLPIGILLGMKLLAFLALLAEDLVASYQVRREARRLLNEAEKEAAAKRAEEEAAAAARGEDVDAGPSPNTRRNRFLGFGSSPKRGSKKGGSSFSLSMSRIASLGSPSQKRLPVAATYAPSDAPVAT